MSEFNKHRDAIERVAVEIQGVKKEMDGMALGLRAELDEVKDNIRSLQSDSSRRV